MPSFGTDGGINLVNGLDRDPTKLFVAPTSPVMIYKNLFFVSGLVGEETPGHIRAFDVLTGKQQWIFHTIPYPQDKGYETWDDTTAYRHMGSTNSWAGFSLDEKRGILFTAMELGQINLIEYLMELTIYFDSADIILQLEKDIQLSKTELLKFQIHTQRIKDSGFLYQSFILD